MDRPETIEDTAELVTAAGGEGVAVRCDHTDADEVATLVDRIRKDHGRLGKGRAAWWSRWARDDERPPVESRGAAPLGVSVTEQGSGTESSRCRLTDWDLLSAGTDGIGRPGTVPQNGP